MSCLKCIWQIFYLQDKIWLRAPYCLPLLLQIICNAIKRWKTWNPETYCTYCELVNLPKTGTKVRCYKKIRKCLRNLFSVKLEILKWHHNHSQSPVLVSQFCTPAEVKLHICGTSKHRDEKSISNILYFFAILISTLWRFYRANKKNLSYNYN